MCCKDLAIGLVSLCPVPAQGSGQLRSLSHDRVWYAVSPGSQAVAWTQVTRQGQHHTVEVRYQ